jgi:hypothetical protein
MNRFPKGLPMAIKTLNISEKGMQEKEPLEKFREADLE